MVLTPIDHVTENEILAQLLLQDNTFQTGAE
jgi:hypothetical protein